MSDKTDSPDSSVESPGNNPTGDTARSDAPSSSNPSTEADTDTTPPTDATGTDETGPEEASLPPITEFLTQYDTRRFRDELSSEPLLGSQPLLETPQQLVDQSTATIGRPTRTYPPTAVDRFPELATVVESQVPRGDVLRLQMPYQQSLHGSTTIAINVPAVSAFERIGDRPRFFTDCDPTESGIHDTNFLMDTHAGVIDLSVVYGIYDERSGLNYGLRIVTDTDGVLEAGQFIILIEGQETSLIISPAELHELVRHTACGFVTPVTDTPTQTADCQMLARQYAQAVAQRGGTDSLTVRIDRPAETETETGTETGTGSSHASGPGTGNSQSSRVTVDATCPITTPTGTHDLFLTETVRVASADSVPTASVGIDFERLVAVTNSTDELTTAALSTVAVSLDPDIPGASPTTIPLPVLADGLALGQYQPVEAE